MTQHANEQRPDYHGHPSYVGTWAALVVLFVVSLGLGYLGHSTAAVVMVFALALVKAALVAGNFMHLRWEPKLLAAFVGFAVLCLGFFYFGVLPDIVLVDLRLAK